MPSSINELASRLNLSKGTVSRILNHKDAPFSEETRQRVLAMAQEIGYYPNPLARALAIGRTGVVALWVRDLLNSYHAHVAHFMEAQLEQRGYQVMITVYGRVDQPPGAYLSPPGVVDGLIAHDHAWLAPLPQGAMRVPVISTGAGYDANSRDYVGVDLSAVAVEAIQHLVQPGRRRVAYLAYNRAQLGYDNPNLHADPRYKAYLSVMTEAGLAPESIIASAEDRASVRVSVREYVQAHGCPEAIFCHNDDLAIAAYRALCDLKIRVPDDVALFGCDGIEDTEYLPTPISTIAQPFALMGETAWRFLERRLAEPDAPPQQVILQPTLRLRESSLPC